MSTYKTGWRSTLLSTHKICTYVKKIHASTHRRVYRHRFIYMSSAMCTRTRQSMSLCTYSFSLQYTTHVNSHVHAHNHMQQHMTAQMSILDIHETCPCMRPHPGEEWLQHVCTHLYPKCRYTRVYVHKYRYAYLILYVHKC